jgi:hypothetical protein
MMRRFVRVAMLGIWLGVSLIVIPQRASAGYLNDAGLGAASALTTFIYAPIKIGYAVLGGVLGGLGYLVSVGSVDVAKKIWVPSMGGTYVITPEMLQGDRPIRFFGSDTSELGSGEAGY